MALEPITREEQIMSGKSLTPITREEMFLAKAGGQNVQTPTPITRKEMFLQKIAESGGSGGSGGGVIIPGKNITADTNIGVIENLNIVCRDETIILKHAFNNCNSLVSVECPNVTTIGENGFFSCRNLTSARFPKATNILSKAFELCSSLEEIHMPEATVVRDCAFENCSGLESVDLPVATTIDDAAFYGCLALDTLILRSNTLCDMDIAAIMATNIVSAEGMPTGQGFVYVPTALYESYIADLVPKVIAVATAGGMSIDEATATYMVTMILRKIEDYPEICGGAE